jgi:hypothetical protein
MVNHVMHTPTRGRIRLAIGLQEDGRHLKAFESKEPLPAADHASAQEGSAGLFRDKGYLKVEQIERNVHDNTA